MYKVMERDGWLLRLMTTFMLFVLAVAGWAQIVLPTPEKVVRQTGCLTLESGTSMYADDTTAFYLKLFCREVLKTETVDWKKKASRAVVSWRKDTSLPAEGYRVRITPRRMEVAAADNGGFLYAVQTLRQWGTVANGILTLPCAEITDHPRIGWRSFMLDSGRQYQKVATVKKYIDMAALLKMNRFHWHLTEGLGWRVEIKQYPKLTQTGSFVGKGEEQQGFYTQEEIRDIVAYAQERNVTVVPEIDMPGHAEAALSAHPELSCFGHPVEVPRQGFTAHIFCAGKDSTLVFLKNVLDEVCMLFPSEYIHLGGDEAPKKNWNKCPDCQKRISVLGLKNSHELQLWFSAEMANHLKSKDRKAVFWGDVLYGDDYPLPENTVIHWWNYRGHGERALRNALKHGHPVVCGTNYYTYLNFPLTPWRGYEAARTFDLRDVYTANPSEKVLREGNPLVLGMSCALWTDDGVTERLIDRRLFPRILALAEQMWHQEEEPDFEGFHQKVKTKQAWLEQLGYEFGPALKEEVAKDYSWD